MNQRNATRPLAPADRAALVEWSRSRTLAARIVLRSRIVLMLDDGLGVAVTAQRLGVARGTVRLWRQRLREGGPWALHTDAPGRGRKPRLDAFAREVLCAACQRNITLRSIARELGVSVSTVSRWRRRVAQSS